MKFIKKLSGFSAALIMAASIGTAHAEESDLTQIRTQDRLRTENNQQTPASDFNQSRNSEQKMVKNQTRNKYQYRNNFQTRQGNSGANYMNRQNMSGSGMGGSRR